MSFIHLFSPLDDFDSGCRAGLLPSREMPRSFLVKRRGLHHLRHAEGSPSPGTTTVTFNRLEKKKRSWDTSHHFLPVPNHSDGKQHLEPFGPKFNGGRRFHICLNSLWSHACLWGLLLFRDFVKDVIFIQLILWSNKVKEDFKANQSRAAVNTINVIAASQLTGLSFFLGCFRSADLSCPDNPDNYSCVEKAASCPPSRAVWSRSCVSSVYTDTFSTGLEELNQHPQVLRESKSSGYMKISSPRRECQFCSKVWHHFFTVHLHLT